MTRPESKEKRNSRKRINVPLDSKLERNLFLYTAAASAASVAMLAPQLAEAKIVYTPANQLVSPSIALDLNHDGIVDYNLTQWGAASVGGSLRISYLLVCHDALTGFSHQCVSSTFDSNAENVVRTVASGAAPLPFGAPIGPGQRFGGANVRVVMGGRDFYPPYTSIHPQKWYGPWVNGGVGVSNRYLGLKFKIKGEWHFGWARLTVTTTPNSGFSATLTGYAYETAANTLIHAGQTTETAEIGNGAVAPERSAGPSLGALALGEAGLSIWRRE